MDANNRGLRLRSSRLLVVVVVLVSVSVIGVYTVVSVGVAGALWPASITPSLVSGSIPLVAHICSSLKS